MDITQPICGLWISPEGEACVSVAELGGGRRELREPGFLPFLWASAPPPADAPGQPEAVRLAGEGALTYAYTFPNPAGFREYLAAKPAGVESDALRTLEHQWLLRAGRRLFGDLLFRDLRRCQLDIETYCSVEDGFCDPRRAEDRLLAIGMQGRELHLLTLEELSDDAERALLLRFNAVLQEEDPDILEGHNLFKFDLDYLRQRARRLKVPMDWGRFGQKAAFRPSRLRVAERWIDFPRCDLPGRAVFDTYLMVQLYDIAGRELPSYGLKQVAVHLGITDPAAQARTYLTGRGIQEAFFKDRDTFLAYLRDDLRETRGIADLLLPTYVAQARNFPMLLQEISLRGTAHKVELVLLEKYCAVAHSLPAPAQVAPYEGAFTRSFRTGVFRHVLHFDVASLYPSLLLLIDRNPAPDTLGIFLPLLRGLREDRLRYKALARTAAGEDERREAQARQQSFKILINSFYGYLGFSGARFADGALAAEVTARGRQLLQDLIGAFEAEGCAILEADTDGIYLSSEAYFEKPDALLEKVARVLPSGIELEFDGRYEAMLCYKAKNYALYDGKEITIKGSALRSRGTEPFLKELTDALIMNLLGAAKEGPDALVERTRSAVLSGKFPVDRLVRSEFLSQSPETYTKGLEMGDQVRRPALEAALRLERPLRMGEQVAFYIACGDKVRGTADWQRAWPYEPGLCGPPYDPTYYAKKLDDWLKRYGEFFLPKSQRPEQIELF